jgi:lipid-binding SYLF domain-containing protein
MGAFHPHQRVVTRQEKNPRRGSGQGSKATGEWQVPDPGKEDKMKAGKRLSKVERVWLVLVSGVVSIAIVSFPIHASAVDDRMEADQLVEKARMAFDGMVADPNMGALIDLLKSARGVFICPELLKGAFIVGVSGGSGVFLARGEKTWYGPAFYTIGGASFGPQIGGQASEVVLVVMTGRGITSLLSTSAKLGADAGIAVGPIGIGASAATANLSADIISFSRAKGLYGGLSLDGAVVAVRDRLNDAYYGRRASPADIFIRHEVKNPQAERLIQPVEKIAGK